MLAAALGLVFGVFLSYANGANDNFKGVATLYGSRTASYRKALVWATLTTGAGSLAALLLAQGLIAAFSGKGLVPDSVVQMKAFALSVGLAAATTVMLATRFGLPISTTHALTGALVGSGLFASATGVDFSILGKAFFMPLLVSPLISLLVAAAIYPIFRMARARLGVRKDTCVCVGEEVVYKVSGGSPPSQAIAMARSMSLPVLHVGSEASCVDQYEGKMMGLTARSMLDSSHFLSSGIVSFARGLNDTPKLAAVLIAASALSAEISIVTVAIAIAVGGLFNARRVADTLARKITEMNSGQGFSANLVTGLLVIIASRFGMPVSTTHVSCGALFGIGITTGQARRKTILTILMAWVTTLPLAAALGMVFFQLMSRAEL